jgi:hypothetical protein
MKRPMRTLAAVALLLALTAAAAHATEDFCITVTKTPDGFLALREGPGTQYKMLAKLMPGFPLDADTGGGHYYDTKYKWIRVWYAARKHGYVYGKYTEPRDCPEETETSK